MKMEQIDCSETSAYIIQTPGNYPKENTKYSEHGESLKSRIIICSFSVTLSAGVDLMSVKRKVFLSD